MCVERRPDKHGPVNPNEHPPMHDSSSADDAAGNTASSSSSCSSSSSSSLAEHIQGVITSWS